jgi:hypothetical protein
MPISSLFGLLAKPGTPELSIEDTNRVAADGWTGKR